MEFREPGTITIPNPQKVFRLVIIGLVALLLLVIVVTSFYTVGPEERAIVLRFGKMVGEPRMPGLHWKFPYPIETRTNVKVEHVYKEEFGYRTVRAGVRTQYADPAPYQGESNMLTGDLNIGHVEWIIQYKIHSAPDYLFNVRNVKETIRDASETVMREVVGDRSVSEVLTVGRSEIASEAERKLQEVLNGYGCGVDIVTVQLQDVTPPEPVKAAFNEVNEARQEKERITNQAWEAYNKAIPEAEGKALRMYLEAEGYRTARINRAQGDAERFIKFYQQYKQAKTITKSRIYLETMAEVYPNIKSVYIVDEDLKGIVPLLQLMQGQSGKGGRQ
ncbi:FtsH protease activity modulator HflK [Acidobacteriota bacterium]